MRYRVASADELAPGSPRRVVVGDQPICVTRVADGAVYAIEDRCTHEEASLSDGEIWDTEIECPLHGSVFDLRTGAVVGPPATENARTFAVVISGLDVYVEI